MGRGGMPAAAVLAVAAALFAGTANAIYPSDHWQYSTKLAPGTFDDFVKENVDSGKTVFVRFIASEG